MDDLYLRPQEAADYLRSSVSTLAKARWTGRGPIFVRIGRAVRYRKCDLDSWMAQTAHTEAASFEAVTACEKPAVKGAA
jgi:excisionase family DNA binding protein